MSVCAQCERKEWNFVITEEALRPTVASFYSILSSIATDGHCSNLKLRLQYFILFQDKPNNNKQPGELDYSS